MTFLIVTGIQAYQGASKDQEKITFAQKVTLSFDIFLVASAAIAASLMLRDILEESER
jgi:hypothetical protein